MMHNKKILVLPFMAILFLSLIGVAYSHWSDFVIIQGSAKMGTVSIGYTEFFCLEMYEYPPDSGLYVLGEWEDKDVGFADCEMVDLYTDPHTGLMGYKKGIVTITDAYPCYRVHMVFTVKNLGTIPVIFQSINVVDPTNTLKFTLVEPKHGVLYLDDGDDILEPGEERINVYVVNLIGLQLHGGEDTKAEIDLHFKQAAEECHTYEFAITIEAIQWNKYVAP